MIFDKVKKMCKCKNVSISYVEHKANLGNGTISKWNTSKPTAENLKAVADVLEVDINELLN